MTTTVVFFREKLWRLVPIFLFIISCLPSSRDGKTKGDDEAAWDWDCIVVVISFSSFSLFLLLLFLFLFSSTIISSCPLPLSIISRWRVIGSSGDRTTRTSSRDACKNSDGGVVSGSKPRRAPRSWSMGSVTSYLLPDVSFTTRNLTWAASWIDVTTMTVDLRSSWNSVMEAPSLVVEEGPETKDVVMLWGTLKNSRVEVAESPKWWLIWIESDKNT